MILQFRSFFMLSNLNYTLFLSLGSFFLSFFLEKTGVSLSCLLLSVERLKFLTMFSFVDSPIKKTN